MSAPAIKLFGLSSEAIGRLGRIMLWAGFAFGLLLVFLMARYSGDVLLFFPAVLLVGMAGWYLFQRPLLNTCVLLAGIVLIVDYEEGIQITEVLYGLYYLAFMAHWVISRRFLYRERLLHTAEERALFLFMVILVCSVPLTILFGGNLRGVFSEGLSFSMLLLYFPVKEVCVRYKKGAWLIVGVIAWVGLFIALRNVLNYQEILIGATQTWQVATGRVSTNDGLMMVPSLVSLVFLIFARRWKHQVVLLGFFLLFFSGLILTQSRGYWVSFLLGAFAMFLLVDRQYKMRLVTLGVAGLVGVLAMGFLLFPDYFMIILTSLVERFASLGTATTKDLSLVNRFYETKAVWERIVQNPILGHGMGVSYSFYDLTFDFTRVDTFIHNGYASLWYKFGIFGLGTMLFYWLRAAWRGVQVFRITQARSVLRLSGLAAAITLVAFTLSTNTSNPLFLNDTTYIFGVLTGLIGGSYARANLEKAQ